MREPGGVLLVACYELGHQPLAIAWPAAVLERLGFHPAVMDVSVEPFDEGKAARARLVAISVPMHTALRVGMAVAERVRTVNPSCHITLFGLYASLNAEHLLTHGADSVVGGEVEQPLAALALALEAGRAGPEAPALPGVTRAGRATPPHLSREALPRPSRAALPSLKRYVHLERDGRLWPTGYAEASRGCQHLCRHCPIPPVYGGRFFAVAADIVMEDIRQQVEAGAAHITFGDPDFLNGPTHAQRIARSLHRDFPEVTFDFTAKIEHLLRHRRVLPELASLGCLFVVSAAESLSDTVLAHLDKGHTRADILEAVRLLRDAAIHPRPTWVPFTPWTTLADYREMLDFVEAEDLIDHVEPVQYSLRLLVPPGSLLAQSPAMRPYLGPLVARDFAYRWDHPDPRMEALHEDVAATVSAGAERSEDTLVAFNRVRALADAAAGPGTRPPAARVGPVAERRPPRLTEPWFC
jgi:radical SAM superfamily enzyme YgiQ (UPF0313 family)